MKRLVILVGGFLVLLLVTFFYKQIGDFAYAVPYKFNHHQFEQVNAVSQDREGMFDHAIPRGSLEMNSNDTNHGFAFSYSSFYDAANNKYYYRFRNYGQKKFCANSRILAPLFGKIRIALSSNEILYFVVESSNPPIERSTKFDLQDNCSIFSFGGSSIDLTVPQ